MPLATESLTGYRLCRGSSQGLAAVREFGSAKVRSGSFTTDAVEATRCMSAVARKRTNTRSSRYVRLVPKAAVSNCSQAALYSVTPSARASSIGGTSKSSVGPGSLIVRNSPCKGC
jgi:hypothetical protein